jgi:septum site-determining protein MinD
MIVAVVGGKGGVGKTTVSLNLGRELDALLVDGDLATTDLPTGEGPGIHSVLAGRTDPRDGVERIRDMELLSASHSVEGARAAEIDRMRDVIGTLERSYERIMIDCPAGLAKNIGVYLDIADFAVIVTTPDPAARTDAAKTRELAVEVGTPLAAIALNKVPETQYNEDDLAELQTEVEADLGAKSIPIPADPDIETAQTEGVPISDLAPDIEPATQFGELATQLIKCERRL